MDGSTAGEGDNIAGAGARGNTIAGTARQSQRTTRTHTQAHRHAERGNHMQSNGFCIEPQLNRLGLHTLVMCATAEAELFSRIRLTQVSHLPWPGTPWPT